MKKQIYYKVVTDWRGGNPNAYLSAKTLKDARFLRNELIGQRAKTDNVDYAILKIETTQTFIHKPKNL